MNNLQRVFALLCLGFLSVGGGARAWAQAIGNVTSVLQGATVTQVLLGNVGSGHS